MSNDSRLTTIEGGTVVTPTETIDGGVVEMADGRIVTVGTRRQGSRDVDASDKYVLPGFVDLHGDDIEQQVFPRADDRVDLAVALDRADIASVSAGTTTKFHAVAFEEAPDDNRSVEFARRLATTIRQYNRAEESRIDNRLHLRCELTNPNAVATVDQQLREGADLVSLMTHIPGEGQFTDEGSLKKRYSDGGTVTNENLEQLEIRRSNASTEHIQRAAAKIADTASERNVSVASHDDEDSAAVKRAAELGVEVSEYPLSSSAARQASELGMTVVMGAPNVVRGGSMWNGPDANRAIRRNYVDALCSDFRPQSLLSAVFVDNGDSLPERVRRVSTIPAIAAGLHDRGRLEPGCRGDIIIVDPDPNPTVTRAFVAGKEVYRSG